MDCAGDESEACGGYNAINVYYVGPTLPPTSAPSPAPTSIPLTDDYSYLECFTDPGSTRVLTGASYKTQTDLTIAVRRSCIVCATVCFGCQHAHVFDRLLVCGEFVFTVYAVVVLTC